MAENVLLKEQLTDKMIEAGGALLQKLDEMGMPISIAMWFFDSEGNDWRLLLTTPWQSSRPSQELYLKIFEAQDLLGPLKEPLGFSIRLLDRRRDIAKEIAASVHIGPGAPPKRYKGGFRGYNDDALIYRSVA